MYKLKDIQAVHFELTEKCNLSCLMCDRNIKGGKRNPFLKNRELSFETIKNTFNPDLIKQLKRAYFCGNYGEPILANSLMPTLKYFKENNKHIKLSVITNGSSRPTYWWNELAKFTNSVRFGIDGLEDTHKIYRQNSIWSMVLKNAKAYIDAGGYAIWDYLVFGHNEHQIDQARELSEKLGFKEFIVKKTGRFFSNVKMKGKDEYLGLQKPKSQENINNSLRKEKTVIKKYGSMDKYLDQSKIQCKVLKTNELFISAEGIVLPCCWLGSNMYKWYLPERSTEVWKFIDKNKLSIYKNTLEDILTCGIFDDIENSWTKDSISEGKLKVCSIKCGSEINQFEDQYK